MISSRPKHTYFYSIVRYRNSLIGSPAVDIPIAVIVEPEGENSASMMGYMPPQIASFSELSRAVIDKLPETLIQQVVESRSKNNTISVIDALSANNLWNIYLTKTAKITTEHNLKEITLLLFARNVDVNANPS